MSTFTHFFPSFLTSFSFKSMYRFIIFSIIVALFPLLYSSPAHSTSTVSDLSCSPSSLISMRPQVVSCSFSSDIVFSSVIIKFTDGPVSSPVPSGKFFSYTKSFPVYSSSFSFPLSLWKSTDVKFTFLSSELMYNFSTTYTFKVKPSSKPVKYPSNAVLKKNHFTNPDPRPLGTGVNSSVTKLPSSVKNFMSGISHQKGCVPFSSLRLISFNYYSIDGFIYRGFLVSHESVAFKVRKIVDSLFDYRFPLHSAHLPDIYGLAPSGKGASDYKSMASGNTSMFNCRYVVGKESSKILSPHAYGKAIDINTWENPYLSRTGVYPNRFWLVNRLNHPLVFSKNHKVVKLLAKHGFSWGGSFKDYHHFQL